MFKRLIQSALQNRLLVIALAAFLFVYGSFALRSIPVDVFPDLGKPIVTILTESHGMAPEDVETLVTLPVETAMSGMPGVERVRSNSAVGLSMVFVEFSWGTDIYRNRQLVSERLSRIQSRLPQDVTPSIGPITSLMGDIQLVGLLSPDGSQSPMELRTLADWIIRPRLLSLPGVAQVTVMGGEVKQYQILISSEKVKYYGLTFEELEHSLSHLSQNTSGGFVNQKDQALLIRNIGSVESLEDIEQSVVGFHLGSPILVKDIADIRLGAPSVKFGDASINGKDAVLLTIRKQPDVNTVELTQRLETMLKDIASTLPPGVHLEDDMFKQSRFIETAVHNVQEVLRDGALMVTVVLFLFLLNFRTTLISLTAIPLSFVITFVIFKLWGLTINTMTLGGLAIAIGELVDDAIVDVENVFRRLRENRNLPQPRSPLKVIYEASLEIRSSIVFATLIVIFVFIPLFQLSGLEGRLFIPLGIAYIVSLSASLFVSLTVTPVLCSFLLPQAPIVEKKPSWLVRTLQRGDRRVLNLCLDHPFKVVGGTLLLFFISLLTLPFMGSSFLPEFQESTAMVSLASAPGTSLQASNRVGREAERRLLEIPEIKSVYRKTGRAREDEHVHSVSFSEIDVDFHKNGRPKKEVLADIRERLSTIPGVSVNLGQPLSHRIDHMMSGVSAQVAIKLFGPDLGKLRRKAQEIFRAIKDVEGLVDLQVEPQTLVQQNKIHVLRDLAAEKGIIVGDLTHSLETALHGKTVAQVIDQQRTTDVVMQFDQATRSNLGQIEDIPIRTLPNGLQVTLKDVADIYQSKGPNLIARENQRRRIVVQANIADRDIGSIMKDVQKNIREHVELPSEYFVTYDGQFKHQQEATKKITYLSLLSLLGVFIILWIHFHSAWLTTQVLLSIPLAGIGALFALFFTDRTMSIASLIGLITLCGIASRNTIMMISHYIHLMKEEGEGFTKSMVIRGSLERMVPVLMTSLTAILALIPLALSAGQPGKEILHPLSVVIIGGLVSSTLLDLVVTPVIFYHFGRRATMKALAKTTETL